MTRTSVCLALLFTLAASPLEAGYVFLKNGYILQGQVLEKDSKGVVLAYPGGKVTVERRYIKHVVLDPSEEAMHEARRSTAETPRDSARLERHVPLLELPEHLSEILPPSAMEPGPEEAPTAVSPTTVTDVRVLDPTPAIEVPVPDVGEPEPVRRLQTSAVSIDVPRDWQFEAPSEDVSEIRVDGRNSIPGITLRSFVGGPEDLVAAGRGLADSLSKRFPSAQIEAPVSRVIGGAEAWVVTGAVEDTGILFEQILMRREEGMFLIGLQWMKDTSDDVVARLRASVETMKFNN